MPETSCLTCARHRFLKQWRYLDQPSRAAHICTHPASIHHYAGEGFVKKSMHGVSCDVARRMPSVTATQSVDVVAPCGPRGAHWTPNTSTTNKGRARA